MVVRRRGGGGGGGAGTAQRRLPLEGEILGDLLDGPEAGGGRLFQGVDPAAWRLIVLLHVEKLCFDVRGGEHGCVVHWGVAVGLLGLTHGRHGERDGGEAAGT